MNGVDNPIVFYPVSLLIVVFAFLAVYFKNIFYSLLSAILVFFLVGVVFYILGAEYNAVIQIAIYGLAVPVILGIAIMFTNLKNNRDRVKTSSALKFAVVLTSALFILAVVYLFLTSFAIMPLGFNISEHVGVNPISSISAFGVGIFNNYVWAFELVSLILTIIIVGLSLFKKEIKAFSSNTEERSGQKCQK